MLTMLLHWLLTTLVLLFISTLLPGISLHGFGIALMAAAILGVVNLLIRPLVMFLTMPLNLVTLGLFAFIVNALMFAFAAWLVPGFEVSNFLSALVGAFMLAALTGFFGNLVSEHKQAV